MIDRWYEQQINLNWKCISSKHQFYYLLFLFLNFAFAFYQKSSFVFEWKDFFVFMLLSYYFFSTLFIWKTEFENVELRMISLMKFSRVRNCDKCWFRLKFLTRLNALNILIWLMTLFIWRHTDFYFRMIWFMFSTMIILFISLKQITKIWFSNHMNFRFFMTIILKNIKIVFHFCVESMIWIFKFNIMKILIFIFYITCR